MSAPGPGPGARPGGTVGLAQAREEVDRALHQQLGAHSLLARLLDLAVSAVPGCEHAGLSMEQDGRAWSPVTSGPVPALVDRLQHEVGQGPCLEAAGRQPCGTDDLAAEARWPRFAARAARDSGVRSILSVPLTPPEAPQDAARGAERTGGPQEGARLRGALNLYSTRPRAFDAAGRAVAVAFTAHASAALQGALERGQASIAVALQRSLLTDLPAPPGLQLEAAYRPSAAGHEVGGDWYDAFVLPDGATALVVGDVTGHDIAAAAAMGALRNVLRGIAWDRQAPPSEVLGRLDSAMQGLGTGRTATGVFARLEPTGAGAGATTGPRRLRWASAGHLPPVLLSPDGAAELLTTPPELLLGVRAGTARSDHSATLHPGSTLLLYTDGLVERRGEPLSAGIERLARTLAPLGGAPLPELLDAVMDTAGAGFHDDTTVLAVRPAPHPDTRPDTHPDTRPAR